MHFLLRDWDRLWSLASGPAAHAGTDRAVDSASAVGILSSIVLEPYGRDCLRRALASSYPRGPRPVPADVHGLRIELAARLRNQEWVLYAGHFQPGYKGVGGGARSMLHGEAQTWPEPEELIPLFDPIPPAIPAIDPVVEVELSQAEAEPSELRSSPTLETEWYLASVVVEGEEAVPEMADPESDETIVAWDLESVTVTDEEMVPDSLEPELREAVGAWDVESVVVGDEEVVPES